MAQSADAAAWAAAVGTIAASFVGLFGVYWGFHLARFRPDVTGVLEPGRTVAAVSVVNRGRMPGVVARVMVMSGQTVKGVEIGTSASIRKAGANTVALPFAIGPGESALLVVDLASELPEQGYIWVGFGDRSQMVRPKPLGTGTVAEGSMLPPSARTAR